MNVVWKSIINIVRLHPALVTTCCVDLEYTTRCKHSKWLVINKKDLRWAAKSNSLTAHSLAVSLVGVGGVLEVDLGFSLKTMKTVLSSLHEHRIDFRSLCYLYLEPLYAICHRILAFMTAMYCNEKIRNGYFLWVVGRKDLQLWDDI